MPKHQKLCNFQIEAPLLKRDDKGLTRDVEGYEAVYPEIDADVAVVDDVFKQSGRLLVCGERIAIELKRWDGGVIAELLVAEDARMLGLPDGAAVGVQAQHLHIARAEDIALAASIDLALCCMRVNQKRCEDVEAYTTLIVQLYRNGVAGASAMGK